MPQRDSKGQSQDFEENALVTALRPDPSGRAAEYHLVRGWVGRSTISGTLRLYPSPDLDEYVELDAGDVLYQKSLDGEGKALGGSILAIRADAVIRSMGSETISARAGAMLDGHLMRRFAATSDPAQLAAAYTSAGPVYDTDYTKGFLCSVSVLFACATHDGDDWVCTLASGKLCGTANYA